MTQTFNVLFLCTGNSARSIMAEALLNHLGQGRFKAYSAGSLPIGTVHPLALATLERADIPVVEPRSKSWLEFAGPAAPHMDFVITVCDHAANETCPAWPGRPITAHWGVFDPAAVKGDEAALAFKRAFVILERRIGLFTALNVDSLERLMLQGQVREIGQVE